MHEGSSGMGAWPGKRQRPELRKSRNQEQALCPRFASVFDANLGQDITAGGWRFSLPCGRCGCPILAFFTRLGGAPHSNTARLSRSPPNESSDDMAFPHPPSRKSHRWKEDIPGWTSVARKFFKRTIDITQYRNTKDEVNPPNNRTLRDILHDDLVLHWSAAAGGLDLRLFSLDP